MLQDNRENFQMAVGYILLVSCNENLFAFLDISILPVGKVYIICHSGDAKIEFLKVDRALEISSCSL